MVMMVGCGDGDQVVMMVDYDDYSGQAVITVVMVGCDDDDDDDGQVVIVVMMVGCGDGGQVVIGPKKNMCVSNFIL